MKTSELTGAALDWAVAKCESIEVSGNKRGLIFNALLTLGHISRGQSSHQAYSPSTNWAQGGPIIEAWAIDVGTYRGAWRAARHVGILPTYGYGPTPLIAAMRCYVASKMGDTVEVPEGIAC
jgi:hypothetical protein